MRILHQWLFFNLIFGCIIKHWVPGYCEWCLLFPWKESSKSCYFLFCACLRSAFRKRGLRVWVWHWEQKVKEVLQCCIGMEVLTFTDSGALMRWAWLVVVLVTIYPGGRSLYFDSSHKLLGSLIIKLQMECSCYCILVAVLSFVCKLRDAVFLKAIQGRKVLDLFISLFCIFLCWCSCLKQCSTQMRPQHYLCNDE